MSGEIDIIEGVHDQAFNQYTLHTAPGCTLDTSKSLSSLAPSLLSAIDQSKIFTGSLLATECDAAVNYNAGCGILDTDGRSYGAGLNAEGGGVFATLWDAEGIRICVFSPFYRRSYYSCVLTFSICDFRVLPSQLCTFRHPGGDTRSFDMAKS